MAKLFCVSYDLSKDGDYSKLIDKIKDSSDWWHQSGSVWFISSEDSAVEIRDSLKQFLQPSDKLFVFNDPAQVYSLQTCSLYHFPPVFSPMKHSHKATPVLISENGGCY